MHVVGNQAQESRPEGEQGSRAVVFGATGGIGAAVVAQLAEGGWRVAAGSRSGAAVAGAADAFAFDLTDTESLVTAADSLCADPPRLIIVATGVLTLSGGQPPEKSYRQLDADRLAEAFRVNAIGPALIASHMLPLLPRKGRSVFAALGARVGSIGDNRLGGWYGYRASKAALAMLIRTFAIELARTHPEAVMVGLHPGTVDTPLSEPFQRTITSEKLNSPTLAAQRLVAVIEDLTCASSGSVLDWAGKTVPP